MSIAPTPFLCQRELRPFGVALLLSANPEPRQSSDDYRHLLFGDGAKDREKTALPGQFSYAIRRLHAIALLLGVFQLTASLTYGHGVVGDRTFISPIVGNDAFPDNALSFTVRRSNYDLSLLPEVEKLLSDNSNLLLISGWDQLEQKGSPDPSGNRSSSGNPSTCRLITRWNSP